MAFEQCFGHLLSCRQLRERTVCLAKPLECFWWGAEARQWMVGLLLGCVAFFRADGAKGIFRGGRDGIGRGRPEGCFLSKWSIHKTPPPPSPDGTSPCLFSPPPPPPAQGFVSKRGGRAQSAEKVNRASLARIRGFHRPCRLRMIDGPGPAALHGQL